MGVFLYSNKKINSNKVKEVFESKGHKNVECYVSDTETLIHSGKILINNRGIVKGEALGGKPDDYIVGVGTFFYKNSFGDDALKCVWENLDDVIRNNPIYGHWAFVVRKNGETIIINDMSGSLRLYYYENNGTIVISSSLLGAVASLEGPSFDKVRLSAYLTAHFAHEIPFVEGLENVNSRLYLHIDKEGTPTWKERNIPQVKRIDNTDDAVHYIQTLFSQQTEQLKAIQAEKVSIELTGGLDSRLTTAVLRKAGLNFDFLNYPIFGPDMKVAKLISKGLNKKLLIQTDIRLQSEVEEKYGEFDNAYNYYRQYANPRWMVYNRLQFSGALGEFINTPLSIDYLDDPSLENLLSKHLGGELMTSEYKTKYLNYLVNYFDERGFKKGVRMTEKEIVEFEQLLLGQISDDFMYNSGCQAHIYYYNMFTEWHFFHNITDISFDVKNRRRLTIALIKAIDLELGEYPVLSRLRTKRKSVNSINELPLHYFSYNRFKQFLPKFIVDYLYKLMGRAFDNNKLKDIDFSIYSDIIDINLIRKYPNLYYEILNRMYSVEILRRGTSHLKRDEIIMY